MNYLISRQHLFLKGSANLNKFERYEYLNYDGNDGYVPEQILEPLGEGRYAAIQAYDPKVLTLKRGDRIESLHQVHGWHWCQNQRGEQGWVGGYLLKPA